MNATPPHPDQHADHGDRTADTHACFIHGVIPFADDEGISYAEGSGPTDVETTGATTDGATFETAGVSTGASSGPSNALVDVETNAITSNAPATPTSATQIPAGTWIVRCCECDRVRTTAELGVKVNRARVFHARITAYCTACEWMRRHEVMRMPQQNGGTQSRSGRTHRDAPSR